LISKGVGVENEGASRHACTQTCIAVTQSSCPEENKLKGRKEHQAYICFPSGCFSCFSCLQVAINGANLQNVFMLLTLEPLLARSPFLVLHVRRSNLVGDALRELSIHSDIDLKKPLKVSFP